MVTSLRRPGRSILIIQLYHSKTMMAKKVGLDVVSVLIQSLEYDVCKNVGLNFLCLPLIFYECKSYIRS